MLSNVKSCDIVQQFYRILLDFLLTPLYNCRQTSDRDTSATRRDAYAGKQQHIHGLRSY